jgi:type II secretion system protein N
VAVNWTLWKPRLLYAAFFVVAFLLALRWTFPAEAVKERLILEAGAKGWQVDADDVSPAGFMGIDAENVRAESATGQKFTADRVHAALRLWPMLLGRRSLAFDARLWDGRIRGTAELAGERGVDAFLEGVDLARATPLRTSTGLELLGIVNGRIEVSVAADAGAKPTGRVDLTVKDAGVNGGQLQLPSLGGAFTVPKVALGEVTAALAFADGKGTFERLEAKGGEASLVAEGLYFVVQPRASGSPLFGKAKVKIEPAFWSKPTTAAFKSIAEMALAPARTSDGGYELQVFGTVAQPQVRPAGGSAPGRRPPPSSLAPSPMPSPTPSPDSDQLE